MDSFKSRFSRVLCLGHSSNVRSENHEEPHADTQSARGRDSVSSGSSFPSQSLHPPRIVDPSTNQDPLTTDTEQEVQPENESRKRKKRSQDVSHHTFYVQNSQMRLKLSARNQVSSPMRLLRLG